MWMFWNSRQKNTVDLAIITVIILQMTVDIIDYFARLPNMSGCTHLHLNAAAVSRIILLSLRWWNQEWAEGQNIWSFTDFSSDEIKCALWQHVYFLQSSSFLCISFTTSLHSNCMCFPLSLSTFCESLSLSSLWAPGQTLLFIFLSESNESHMHTHFCI